MMPKLITDAVRAMIESIMLCYVATVNADNTPNLSPKATLSVLEPKRVAFVDIASPGTVAMGSAALLGASVLICEGGALRWSVRTYAGQPEIM